MRLPLLIASPGRALGTALSLILSLAVLTGCGSVGSSFGRSVAQAAPAGPVVPNTGTIQSAAQAALPVQQAETLSGRILFVRDGNLWMWQGGNSRQFSEGSIWSQPAFSPDGSEVAYVHWGDNFADIFLMAADGTDPRRLTRGQAASMFENSWALRPTWSPDGTRLAYISDANSTHNQVWMMAKDGSGRRQLTSEMMGILWADGLSWDPTGDRIAFTAAPDMRAASHIYLLDIASGTYEQFTHHLNGAFDPAFSPDGSALAFIGRPGTQTTLTVQTIDGTAEATFDKLPFLRSPTWSPDGKSLAFLSAQGGVFEIWTIPVLSTATSLALGEPRQLTRDAAVDPLSGLSWAR